MKIATQRIKQQGFSKTHRSNRTTDQQADSTTSLLGAITTATTPNVPAPVIPPPPSATDVPCEHCVPYDAAAANVQSDTKSIDDPFIGTDPLATLNRLLQVSDKLIDLARERGAQRAVQPVLSARATSSEVIVYVHGISEHLPGYSSIWHQALSGHLARPIRIAEVRWSQLVNARAVDSVSSPIRAVETATLTAQIQAELERRTERLETMANRRNASNGESTTRSIIALERSRSFAIDDFTRYMLSESTREAILNEFLKIVVPELEAGSKVHIISHSWGTVVAYEGLRRLDNRSLAGKVSNLFTAGSALSIGAVQSNLFGRVYRWAPYLAV